MFCSSSEHPCGQLVKPSLCVHEVLDSSPRHHVWFTSAFFSTISKDHSLNYGVRVLSDKLEEDRVHMRKAKVQRSWCLNLNSLYSSSAISVFYSSISVRIPNTTLRLMYSPFSRSLYSYREFSSFCMVIIVLRSIIAHANLLQVKNLVNTWSKYTGPFSHSLIRIVQFYTIK